LTTKLEKGRYLNKTEQNSVVFEKGCRAKSSSVTGVRSSYRYLMCKT